MIKKLSIGIYLNIQEFYLCCVTQYASFIDHTNNDTLLKAKQAKQATRKKKHKTKMNETKFLEMFYFKIGHVT